MKVHQDAGSRLDQDRWSHDCLAMQQITCTMCATRLESK